MEEQQLIQLIDKFLEGTASEAEKKQLNDWYANANDQEVLWLTTHPEEEMEIDRRMLSKLKQHVAATRKPVIPLYQKWLPRVAVFAGLSIGLAYYFSATQKAEIHPNRFASVSAPVKFRENKYVLLPDSSTVVLHAGSSVKYSFDGKIRAVELTGEAYFDVKHDINRPFVIRTGKITTTVLGTAFNIKAYPHQLVTVSVTRGKVSVADDSKKTIAVLTPNQQVVYSEFTRVISQHEVKAQETINWAKSDMQFNEVPFHILAERFSRRYNVDVKFKNPDIEKCLITGRFNGTESLDQVLHVLSETMATTYTIEGRTVTLDGKGCL